MNSVFGSKLVTLLQIETRTSVKPGLPVPNEYRHFSRPDDTYFESIYKDGMRLSANEGVRSDDSKVMFRYKETVQYGSIRGFLCQERDETRAIVAPFVLTDNHIEELAKNLLNENVSQSLIQKVMEALSDTSYGSVVKSSSSLIILNISEIMGYAVSIRCKSKDVVVPFTYRPMLS
uniref:Uncharacterized protein n=1 Tax=Caenorhabditis japonica TaxID=281687 RepID=A0A8R1IJ32_CAEJA